MHHSFFDKYSDRKSGVHFVDARVKCAMALFLICFVVTTPFNSPVSLALQSILIISVMLFSRVPIVHFVKRSAAIVPFAMLITISLCISQSSRTGMPLLYLVSFQVIKVLLATIVLTVLSSTTKYQTIIATLSYFKVPSVITSLLYFMYRFVYLLADELEHLVVAREGRDFGGPLSLSIKSRAWLMGSFLLRSAERSDTSYSAMSARGFDGKTPPCFHFHSLRLADLWVALAFFMIFTFVRFGVCA